MPSKPCPSYPICFCSCLCFFLPLTADGQSTPQTDTAIVPGTRSSLSIVHSHQQLKINGSKISFPATSTEVQRLLGKPDVERTVETSNADGRIELTWNKHGITGVKNPKTEQITSIYLYFDKSTWRSDTSLPALTFRGSLKFGQTAVHRKTTKEELVRYGFTRFYGPYPTHLHLRNVPAACTVLHYNDHVHGVAFHDGNINPVRGIRADAPPHTTDRAAPQ